MTDPCDLSATTARALIGRKRLSTVELLESCFARIDAVNPAINALVALDADRARAAAIQAEKAVMRGEDLGPLHGLPLGVKDLTPVAGVRCTWGSPLFRDHVAPVDDPLVARLRAAGAIVIGKTNTSEWGAGANTRNPVYGATGNPFDPQKSAAGSSGGSAAALAAGMAPLCTGTDLGGSLRNPAAFCGVVGFRPSLGLVPGERLLGWSGMSIAGPMARSVDDVALLLGSMVADGSFDPLSRAVPCGQIAGLRTLAHADLSSLRVAFSPDLGFAPTEGHIARVFAAKSALFRSLFARADDAAPDCSGADEAFEVLRATDILAKHGELFITQPDAFGPNVRVNIEEGLRYSASDVGRAEAQRTRLFRHWRKFFESYDFLITPTITISPRPWTELYPAQIDGIATRSYFHWLALAYAVTLTGQPAISLPVGCDEAGMPFGLQIIGRHGEDARLLSVARALEIELAEDPRTARPSADIARLASAPPLSSRPDFLAY